ncbi:Methyl-accepting chemotaxis sensory transducer [Hyella patelloides LEGE 07179]|uniref:Methyl-accepting chemotaxis sensory transducer n=1 Tax=Hyella patelloides LEGE 07179 TaxID=945734 RepID=A0A563W4J9_9CYAN|nr:methyl-accepting chemotaxis protein [Hyella patelloides]VEP18586.1 Methyl-accepting chemotaxis sensory transducer [Hyella patelloides LEGE 07179]
METPLDENIETIKENKDETTPIVASQKNYVSLRKQLLYSLIYALGIPLAVATFWGYSFLEKNTKVTIDRRLSKKALLAKDILSLSLEQAATIPLSMTSNPAVLEAIKEGNKKVVAENMTALSVPLLESNFSTTKLLQPNAALNNYLQITAKNSNFSEIFITESLGLNVAYSQQPSDFAQQDEAWWQKAKNSSRYISDPDFDASSNAYGISLIQPIKDPKTQQFLGVIKAVLPISYLKEITTYYLKDTDFFDSQQVQVIDTQAKKAITTIGGAEAIENTAIIGGDAIARITDILQSVSQKPQFTPEEILSQIPPDIKLRKVTINNLIAEQVQSSPENNPLTLSFNYQDKKYTLTPIPNTSFIVAASIDRSEVQSAANQLLIRFLILILSVFVITTVVILILSRKITNPLRELAVKAQEAASGNLEVRADLIGTTETITLAHSFNNLVEKVEQSIEKQARILHNAEITRREAVAVAEEQQEKNARIQQELLDLLGDVEGASTGDLTVRSRISDGEIGIVADFFNSIIESLREIVAQVKVASEQVNVSVGENQETISQLATEASQQANQITQTVTSVEQITQSIQEVAHNAQEAAKVAHIASNKAELGGESMELTVNSIKQLRGTIDQTADKVKSLGEASQDISRVISLINQIAMQTNLLSINASIEAARAGEEGKGFAVVAEEVGELATQSSEATKEVGSIIAKIQTEIYQVVEAMEIGLSQAEEGTQLVENTKDSLLQIMEVSYQIDHLVQSISKTTVSQAETSQNVTQLMEQIAQVSEQTSQVSQSASNSLESTVAIAKDLQSSVGAFKVERTAETTDISNT